MPDTIVCPYADAAKNKRGEIKKPCIGFRAIRQYPQDQYTDFFHGFSSIVCRRVTSFLLRSYTTAE